MDSTDSKKSPVACQVESIWYVLGKTWSLVVLKNLSVKKTVRFNELKKLLAGISSTVLSDRLSELESNGLVRKKIFAEVPPRVEYSLTNQAKELEKILDHLGVWVKRWETHAKK